MELRSLVTNLCRDDGLPNDIKLSMLQGWRDRLIDVNGDRILDKEQMALHLESLEILDNALRIVGPPDKIKAAE